MRKSFLEFPEDLDGTNFSRRACRAVKKVRGLSNNGVVKTDRLCGSDTGENVLEAASKSRPKVRFSHSNGNDKVSGFQVVI